MITATGMLFLSRGGVRMSYDHSGTPTLTLICVDRIGPHQVEPWTLLWRGKEAADFHDRHGAKLQPGTPLQADVTNLRAHNFNGRSAEITAHVAALSLAPARQAAEQAAA